MLQKLHMRIKERNNNHGAQHYAQERNTKWNTKLRKRKKNSKKTSKETGLNQNFRFWITIYENFYVSLILFIFIN